MAKTGITDLQEALGNPKRPDFASLPDPIREMLSKKKQTHKEMKILNKRIERLKQKEQERTYKRKRVKIELTRSLLREENEPALDWVCPRAQAEKAIRDKFISVRLLLTSSQTFLTCLQGELQGINSWSTPAYAYPTEWSKETRDTWQQVDMLWVSEFEHKSTPHPDEPKDVTVTDEEMDALTKQFAGLKIEVLKKIYWHQYPDGRLEAIHPKLVRVRKDGTFFMYNDEELHESPKLTPTPLPLPARPRRGDNASHPLLVDRPGISARDPVFIKDPIGLDIPGASAAVSIHAGRSGGPIVIDVPGASASDPIAMGMTDTPAASSAPPQATNPIVIVNIPDATDDDMEMASQVKVKGAAESKGNGRIISSTTPAPSSPAVGDAAFANELDVFIAGIALSSSSYPNENVQSALPPGAFDVPEPGTLPAEYPPSNSAPFGLPAIYPVHINQPHTLEELVGVVGSVNMFNVPQAQILAANSVPPEVPAIDPVHIDQRYTLDEVFGEFFDSMNSFNVPQVQFLPANFAPPEVPAINPVHINQRYTLDEVFGEFFDSMNSYDVPQAQILLRRDSDWNAVFVPPTAATVY